MGLVHGQNGFSMVDGMRLSLQMLAMVNGVMLLLPLFVLGTMRSEPSGEEDGMETCGWTSSTLHTTCIAAVCCLCFSFVLTGTQLVVLGASDSPALNSYALRLKRHLPLPVCATAVGSFVGAGSLWGHGVLQHGECNSVSLLLIISAFLAAYATSCVYVYISPVAQMSMYQPEISLPLLPVLPAPELTVLPLSEQFLIEQLKPLSEQLKKAASSSPPCEDAVVPLDKKYRCEDCDASREGRAKAVASSVVGKTASQRSSLASQIAGQRGSHLSTPGSRRGSAADRQKKSSIASTRSASRNSTSSRHRNSVGADGKVSRLSLQSTGVDGKCGSPATEKEEKAGVTKPDRFENAFAERRSSLNSNHADAADTVSEMATTSGKPESLVTRSSLLLPGNKRSSLLAAPPGPSILKKHDVESASSTKQDFSKRKSVCIVEKTEAQEDNGHGFEINLHQSDSPLDCPRERVGSMLDLDVAHFDACPINFNLCCDGKRDSSDDSSGGDDFDPQPEVPLWLMDQKAAQKQQEETELLDEGLGDSHDEHDSEDWSGEEDDEDSFGALPELPKAVIDVEAPVEPGAKRRISFWDQKSGEANPSYSKERKSTKSTKKKQKAILAVKSGSAPAGMGQNAPMYWKVPRPTRRGTMMPASVVRGALDSVPGTVQEKEIPAKKQRKSISAQVPGPPAPVGGPALPGTALRRPSCLSVFNESGVKKDGHYELPQIEEGADQHREVVQVKRQSLIMSSSIMTNVLLQKLDRDQYDDRDLSAIMEGGEDMEIILPFFVAPIKADTFRKCQCRVDPETGFVVHSCMTPSTTLCENTQAFQSYVCSAWGSRRGSAKATQANSRRGSTENGEEDDDTDEMSVDSDGLTRSERTKEREREQREEKMKNKRIRNASMLAVVGRAAPAPAKQNTDGPDDEKVESDSENEKPEENELNISFQSLGRASATMGQPGVELEVVGLGNADRGVANEDDCNAGPAPLDMQVESELCHRFELVQPWEFAEMLLDPVKQEQLLLVDARGRDWVGAHIPSSINLRTSEICSHPESLISQCLRNRINHLVFTCMYSVLRARKSAIAVEKSQEEAFRAGLQPYRIKISLLAGGMHGWVNYNVKNGTPMDKKNPFVQDFDASCWCDGGPSQGGLVHVMDALWSEGGQQALSDALVAELSALSKLSDMSSSRNGSRRASAEQESRRASNENIALEARTSLPSEQHFDIQASADHTTINFYNRETVKTTHTMPDFTSKRRPSDEALAGTLEDMDAGDPGGYPEPEKNFYDRELNVAGPMGTSQAMPSFARRPSEEIP